MTYHSLISASTLEGDQVRNAQGKDLGHVKDIMLDTSSHRIAYYVLSFGGILGMGDKLFAIPPEAMTLDSEKECFIMNFDQELLKKSNGFDKDNWPNMADAKFRKDLYTHYGYADRYAA